MKYTCEVVIDLPRDTVIKHFDNPDNLKHWMTGLLSFEPLSGTPGEVGAKSKLVFKQGSGTMEMTETITERALPERFSGTYECTGVFNAQTNRFEAEGGATRWVAETEFRFDGFMMKAFAFVMPFLFKGQTRKFMASFKKFAEAQPA